MPLPDKHHTAVSVAVVDSGRVFVLVKHDHMVETAGYHLYRYVLPLPEYNEIGVRWRCVHRLVHDVAVQRVREQKDPALVVVVTSAVVPKSKTQTQTAATSSGEDPPVDVRQLQVCKFEFRDLNQRSSSVVPPAAASLSLATPPVPSTSSVTAVQVPTAAPLAKPKH